jgi:hypothetical protein
MSSRKNQNSILFLATLGVYLGLVLTGATPVLGHAATARQFDIRDEIEFTDEFDNKPDDEKVLDVYASALESIFRVSSEIANTNPNYSGGRPYNFEGVVFATPRNELQLTFKGNSVVSRRYTPEFQELYASLTRGTGLESRPVRIAFNVTGQEFEFSVGYTPDAGVSPAAAAASLSSLLPTMRTRASAARALIYENTRISPRDNQVFIVTRLPRAGLATLLANDAK